MGFQDALYIQGIPYSSDKAVTFADHSMVLLSYAAIEASADLAQERGAYQTFDGSLWSKGILPIDSIEQLANARGEQFLKMDRSTTLDWNGLRGKAKAGMRNSNVMAIAPTATISNIVGVCQSIEPTYQNLYVKSNLSGEFTVVDSYLVKALKAEGLWDAVMANDLKYYDGSLQAIERVPEHLKKLFATAFEVELKWLVDTASHRQKWLDQAQSLNLYKGASSKKLDLTISNGMAIRPENHLLFSCPGGDRHREVHRQHRDPQRRTAQCTYPGTLIPLPLCPFRRDFFCLQFLTVECPFLPPGVKSSACA